MFFTSVVLTKAGVAVLTIEILLDH